MKSTVAALLVLLLSAPLAAAVPGYVEYAGRLLDPEGAPITEDLELTIRIFDTPTQGQPLAEASFERTPVLDGFFRVVLPFTSTQVLSLFAADADQYVELEVDGDVLSPRQRVMSLPTSFQAGTGAPAPDWTALEGRPAALDQVAGLVSCPSPSDLLAWSGSGWTCAADATAALSYGALTGVPASIAALAGLSCTNGEVIEFLGQSPVCGTDDTGATPPFSRLTAPDLQQVGALTSLQCRNGDALKRLGGSWTCNSDDTATTTGVTIVLTPVGSGLSGGGSGDVSLAIDPAYVLTKNAVDSASAAPDDANYLNAATLAFQNPDSSGAAWKVGAAGESLQNGGTKSGLAGYASGTTNTGMAANIGVLGRVTESGSVNPAGLAAATNYGLRGETSGGSFAAGIYGKASGATRNEGVRGINDAGGYAGYFNGDLQITGNLIVQGEIIRGAVRYADVSPIDFYPTDDAGGIGPLRRTNNDFVYRANAGSAVASVRLVHGARISGMTCYLYDASNTAQVVAELRQHDAQTDAEVVLITASTPVANSAQTYTLTQSPAAPVVVFNDRYSYVLRVTFGGSAGSSLKYRSCVVAH